MKISPKPFQGGSLKRKNGKRGYVFYSDEAPELLKHLLDAGVSIEVANEKGETLLMVASRSGGFVQFVRMLLAADADTEVEGDGKTMALLQAKISAKISAKWYQILHQERHCAIIEDLLAAEAKDFLSMHPFPLSTTTSALRSTPTDRLLTVNTAKSGLHF